MYGIMEKDLEGPVVRYYVISDVHGFYTPMTDTLKRAGYFDDPQPHKLIILGDLFDRGTEAPALQEFVIDLIERDAVILIRGNHEDLYEELATGSRSAIISATALTIQRCSLPAWISGWR